MGRVNHTVIPEEDNPLIKPEKTDSKTPKTDNNVSKEDISVDEVSPPTLNETLPVVAEGESVAAEDKPGTLTVEDEPVGHGSELVERQPAADSSKTPASVTSTSVGAIESEPVKQSTVSNVRKVEINEADYIDGDLLLEQGGVRDNDDLPYYTWTDEQGIVRNSPYRPESSVTSSKGSQSKAKTPKKPIVYTVYEEHRRSDQPAAVQETTSGKVDSFAQKLFFEGQTDSFIESFSSRCCADLPKESPSTLGFEDSVYVELTQNDESYLFTEGKSPFKLIQLPNVRENYSLKLKTFVKSSGRTGVKNGVFFPQIVFLDDQFQVMRIIRNPALEYVPENWRRHGYLKGLFEIDGRDNERYILINTTKESLRARNRIENKTVVVLNNQKTGSFELEVLRN